MTLTEEESKELSRKVNESTKEIQIRDLQKVGKYEFLFSFTYNISLVIQCASKFKFYQLFLLRTLNNFQIIVYREDTRKLKEAEDSKTKSYRFVFHSYFLVDFQIYIYKVVSFLGSVK